MKRGFTIILSTLSVLIFMVSCAGDPTVTRHSVLVVDVTSADRSAIPDGQVLMGIVKKENANYTDGHIISFTLLDDLSGSPFVEEVLSASSGHAELENPVKRKRQAEEFYAEVAQKINQKLENANIDRNYSKIYIKLCKSLQYLAQSGAEVKQMIIYSDFLENSELANFYRETQLEAAAKNPEKFYDEHFSNSACKLPDLSELNLHLYVTRTSNTDIAVQKAEKFWVELFKAKGAKVMVD